MSKPTKSTKYGPPAIANALAHMICLSDADMDEVVDCCPHGVIDDATRALLEYSRDELPIAEVFDARIDTMRGPEVEELFRELHKRLPPRLLAWAERGWNV